MSRIWLIQMKNITQMWHIGKLFWNEFHLNTSLVEQSKSYIFEMIVCAIEMTRKG